MRHDPLFLDDTDEKRAARIAANAKAPEPKRLAPAIENYGAAPFPDNTLVGGYADVCNRLHAEIQRLLARVADLERNQRKGVK